MTAVGAARVVLRSGEASRVATGVAVLDHLLVELAAAGRLTLTLELAPDEPEAEVGKAGTALGRAVASCLSVASAPGRGFGIAPANSRPVTVRAP